MALGPGALSLCTPHFPLALVLTLWEGLGRQRVAEYRLSTDACPYALQETWCSRTVG